MLLGHIFSEHIHIAVMNAHGMRCTHCMQIVMTFWYASACGMLLAAN